MVLEFEGEGSNSDLLAGSNHEKPTVDTERVKAAILGALLADAASMGCDNMDTGTGEFKDPPTPVGYSAEQYPGHYETGMLSPHGEQLLFAIEYCGKNHCVTAGHMSVRYKEFCESFGGHMDSSMQEFLKCMKAGDRSVELVGADDERGM
jgi:hypothetical protein